MDTSHKRFHSTVELDDSDDSGVVMIITVELDAWTRDVHLLCVATVTTDVS